jgi:hypothetical protein
MSVSSASTTNSPPGPACRPCSPTGSAADASRSPDSSTATPRRPGDPPHRPAQTRRCPARHQAADRDHRQATDRAGPGSSPRPGQHHLPAALPRHHHRAHPATLTSASRLRSRRRRQPVREDPTREHRTAPRQARTRRAPRTGHREHPATHAGQPPPTPAAPRRHQDHPHPRPAPGADRGSEDADILAQDARSTARKAPLRHRRLRPPVRTGPCFVCAILEGHPDYVHRRLRGPGRRQRLHRSEILRHVVSSGSPSHRWKD